MQQDGKPTSKWLASPSVWLLLPLLAVTLSYSLLAGGISGSDSGLLVRYTAQPEADESSRRPVRAIWSESDYEQLATELRSIYSQPSEHWPRPHVDADVDFVELGHVPEPVFPPDNPHTPARTELGRMLFFDPRLSGSRQMACASCHDPDLGWADGRTVSFGNERLPLQRNAPSILNVAHIQPLFWDGRAETLEQQAIAVIENPDELHTTLPDVVDRLEQYPQYVQQFEQAFNDEQITAERISQALATFQRTIVSTGRSDFDRFLAGDHDRLSDAAVRGLHLFRTVARCANCHHGPLLTDNQMHDLGLSYYGRLLEDLGRYEVTGDPDDVGRFKTPSLRNVTRTAPYMHVGLFDLPGVLNMYNAGMPTLRRKPEQQDDPLFPSKSHLLEPLGLNRQDLSDLQAFLQALEEPRRRMRPPQLPTHEQ